MPSVSTISRTELARSTRRTVERVRRGEIVFVRGYDEDQVVILDVLDYRLLRAVALHQAQRILEADKEAPSEDVEGEDPQALWNRVIGAYLDETISLGRAAEQLGISRFELMDRFNRLGLPLALGPQDEAEAEAEIAALDNDA